jgi:hypothetical protein
MSIMQLVGFLSDDEADLVRETEVERMAQLDEDDLLALHARVRRARTKYVKLYRRQASAQVETQGGRGKAYPKNQRSRDKAEIFELALARVSRRVEVLAKRSAAELTAERLAAAQRRGSGPGADGTGSGPDQKATRRAPATKTTGGKKRDASTRAKGARRQAKRDSR